MGEVDPAFLQKPEHRPSLSILEAEGVSLINLSPKTSFEQRISSPPLRSSAGDPTRLSENRLEISQKTSSRPKPARSVATNIAGAWPSFHVKIIITSMLRSISPELGVQPTHKTDETSLELLSPASFFAN